MLSGALLMSLLSRFHKSLLRSGCIPSGSRVLVGVSGGADSVALISLLHQTAENMDLYLEVAHLDHALRDSSRADAQFVKQLCADLGLLLTVERRDVAEAAQQRKGNLEEVARDIRRDFLETVAKDRNCQVIALGHHADDQAETFLMRLLRGSGPSGLSGMRETNKSVVRPLLSFQRKELLAYLQGEGIDWREDESNLDQRFTRNRIRHNLLPLLESYNPKINSQLVGLCELLQQDDDFWSDLVAQELAQCGSWHENNYTLDREFLLLRPSALTGRVIRAALQQVRGDLRGLTSAHIADVQKLVKAEAPQGELNLPGVWVARRYEKLLFGKQKPVANESFEVVLSAPGSYPLPNGRCLHLSLSEQALGEGPDAVEFKAGSLPFPLQVRYSQAGDRFRPSGMDGTKKLQDLFVDLKLTKEERQNILVVLKDDKILWVVGLRRSDGRRPRDGEAVLRISLTP